MDGGAWWPTVHRVAKSQTQLKRLSMHAHTYKSFLFLPEKPLGQRSLVDYSPCGCKESDTA